MMNITLAWFDFLGTLGAFCKPLPNLMICGLLSVGIGAFLLSRVKEQRNAGH